MAGVAEQKRRLLLVVSTWRPAFLADMARVRLMASEMGKQGWEVEILYPGASYQPKHALEQGKGMDFPEVPEHEIGPWMDGFFKAVGSGSIGIRAGVPMARKGLELLQSREYDAVYFSTTQHLLTCAGPWWRRKTGVPYVADVHDPVFIPQPKYRTSRSGLKARLARQIGKWIEKRALAQADGVVSVSRGYVDDLLLRHPAARWAVGERGSGVKGLSNEGKLERVLVQPFPADEEGLRRVRPERGETGRKRIVYCGAGGNIMERGWREFLRQWKKEGEAEVCVEIHGTETHWTGGRRPYLEAVAEEEGMKGLVIEEPERITYERSLALIQGADGLLVLGVDDPHYQPSKLHTYLATGLPVMVLARAGSDLPRQMEGVEGVNILRFQAERRPSFAANSYGGAASSFAEASEDKSEGSQFGIREYLQSVKEGRRWPGRKRLTAKEAAISHLSFFTNIIP